MFKKALVASAVLAATSSVAFANGGTVMVEPTHTCWYYLGVGLSTDFVDLDVTRSHYAYALPVPAFFLGTTTISSWATNWDQALTGINGALYLGTGWLYLDHYYLGVELFGNISNADGDHGDAFGPPNGNPVTAPIPIVLGGGGPYQENMNFRMTSNWGIAGLLGYRYDRALFYARVGWEGARFKANSGEINNTVVPAGYTSISFAQSNMESGLQVGFGIETLLTECLSLRVEYDWNQYNDIDFNVTGSPVLVAPPAVGVTTIPSISQNYSFSAQPTVQSVTLGLTWRFNAV